jgi:hypothetical protein
MLQPGRSWVWFLVRSLDSSINLILPAALWPLGRLSLYHKWVPGIFLGVKGSWCVRLTTSPPSVSQLCRKCGILKSHNPMGLHSLLQGWLYPFFFILVRKILTKINKDRTYVRLYETLWDRRQWRRHLKLYEDKDIRALMCESENR